MAEFVLSVVAEGILAKAMSLASEHVKSVWGFKEELGKLQVSFTKIQALLHDAERRQLHDESVKIWLRQLKDVAYEADDVLDEYDYEILRQKVETQNKMKVRSFFSSSNPVVFHVKMGKRIKTINQSLDEIKNDVPLLGLRESLNPIPQTGLDRETDSFIDGSEVVGRRDDVLKIVNLLIGANNQQVTSVIPIVGMAGLGKTTIAKLVYNHELVKKHFDVKMWVCVSDNFDVKRILREILEILDNNCSGLENKNAILHHLQKKLEGKRYLLILDDVWNEDSEKWDNLRSSLLGINQNNGNKIIVTTHSDNVAQILETSPRHKLEKLSEDECWLIFKEKAFANERIPVTPDLEDIGRKIATRCGGNPLAARVLGGMMRFKEDKSEWLLIQDCLQTLPFFVINQDTGYRIEELGCLSQLQGELRIDNLEHVKDKEEAKTANLARKIRVHKLGFHWSSERESNNDEDVLEGLQPHQNLKSLEIVNFGSEKFPSWLLMRENSSGALLLFDHLLEIRLENCNKCKRIPSLGQLPCLKVLKINGMDNLKCIGAEFYSSYSAEGSSNSGVGSNVVFPALKRLVLERMPNLVEWKDPMEPTTTTRTVFPCLEELTLLDCKKLISAPCHFLSLQKLVISRIRSTVFENITSRLTTLTTLNITSVSELACLSDQLLQNNSSLTHLTIWDCDELVSISSHQDVWHFCTSLRSIRITGCYKLSDLPIALHTLHSLEKFVVASCPNLRSFPSLQGVGSLLRSLGISCADEVLPTGLQSCTSLSELNINYCPNLKSIPNLRQLHSLTKLRIMCCQNLTHLPEELDCLTCLESLEIGGFCEELDAFPSLSSTSIQHLHASLKKLFLYGWDKLKSLPDDIQRFTALRTLWIHKFDRMEALPEWLGNLSSLQNLDLIRCENLMYVATVQRLTKLTMLQISNCPKLKERCAKGFGAEWSNIAHIPLITIDGNRIENEVI